MKKLLILILFIPFVLGCSKDSNITTVNELELQIGDFYQGGIIFQLNSSGTEGKVVSIGDLGIMTRLEGIEACEDFVFEGYYDWYLPAIGDLSLMFNNIGQGADNIGDFSDARYWSSSASPNDSGVFFNFSTGEVESGWNPVLNARIRAIRSF
jgi:hypothetical protein